MKEISSFQTGQLLAGTTEVSPYGTQTPEIPEIQQKEPERFKDMLGKVKSVIGALQTQGPFIGSKTQILLKKKTFRHCYKGF